jgi:sensitive to high expression protein 9
MGVNVLLFLVFQILVEPWRRKRLVKGFEDKVVEALEKEKELNRAFLAESAVSLAAIPSEVVDATSDTEPSTVIEDLPKAVQETLPADTDTATATATAAPSTAAIASDPSVGAAQSLQSRLSGISYPPTSVEYWKQAFHEFFSERSIAVSQRDITTVALQSAATGAAFMGLLFALFRSG